MRAIRFQKLRNSSTVRLMIILGLDIATVTGAAMYPTDKPISAIEAWSFKVTGDRHEEKAASMGLEMVRIIRDRQPDLIAIEEPLKNIVQHKKQRNDLVGEHTESTLNPASVILPNQLVGAALAIINAYRIPWVVIHQQSWRRQFLGFARKKGWRRDDYKRACRTRCDQLKIVCTNNDQADAVGVAFAAPATDIFKHVRNQMEAE